MLKKFYNRIMRDSLYRNAAYLLASTVVNAGFGFFFWVISAHLYSQRDLGIASTMIAMIGLTTSFSLLGFNTGLVRFLPSAKDGNKHINTAFTIGIVTSFVASIVFLLGLKYFTPVLLFLQQKPSELIFFTLSMMAMTLFLMIESVFMAKRASQFVFLKNAIFSVFKLLLPVILVGYGAFGLFASWTIAGSIGTLVAFVLLMRKYNYRPAFKMCKETLLAILPYNLGNYLEGFIGSLPVFILPLMVANTLGPETAAQYAIVMTFITLLFYIPQAIAQSLFAEGSNNEKQLGVNIRKARLITIFILTPTILVLVIFGKYILSIFGSAYSSGFPFMQLMTLSAALVAYNSIFAMRMRIQNRIKGLVILSTSYALVVLFVSQRLIATRGLIGVAGAWIAGQALVAVAYTIIYRRPIASL